MAAKLPESLVKRPLPAYTIRTMPFGESYDARPVVLLVDEDGSCYLNPDAKIDEAGLITIRRDEVGYHVTVRMPGVRWMREQIAEEKKAKLIPVATITVPEAL